MPAVQLPPPTPIDPAMLEKALVGDDLSGLNPAQRMQYYDAVCRSLSLNPLTRPFQFTSIDGKLTLYARKDCAEQLRKRDSISVKIKDRKTEDGLHIVIATATNGAGREDESTGVEPMVEPDYLMRWNPQTREKEPVANPIAGKPLSPANRAKALMKAETKAKRRVTLSIAGLGIPDETELDSIAHGEVIPENTEAAATEKIIKEGGTVESFTPEKEKEKPVVNDTPKATWRDYKFEGFATDSPFFGRTMGEVHPSCIHFLKNRYKWKATQKEMRAAFEEAIQDPAIVAAFEHFETHKEWPKTAQEAARPEKATATPETVQKPATGQQGGKESTPKASKAADWRQFVVDFPDSPVHKVALGAIADSKMGELLTNAGDTLKNMPAAKQKYWGQADGRSVIRALGLTGPAKMSDKPDQIAAIKAAANELKVYDDASYLKACDEKNLRAEILRRFEWLGMDEKKAAVVLKDTIKVPLSEAAEGVLRYVIQDWGKIETLIEAEKDALP